MAYSILELTGRLRAAREKKGLSQRAFSRSIGMPQSRLSRIENGIIDLQISNLLELARALDLEVMLIPRQAVPLVDGLIRQTDSASVSTEAAPLYRLDDEQEEEEEDG
ncbi:MAG: XRE family transcriptional regulator [Desulfobacteraceae bacterium]|nr:MAG: XRE family transcriptional regulator [Desulfobacteraceae bacterium]